MPLTDIKALLDPKTGVARGLLDDADDKIIGIKAGELRAIRDVLEAAKAELETLTLERDAAIEALLT